MQRIEINLLEDEKLELEFRSFEYNGLRINFNQFVVGYDFDEKNYNRLINTLLEKYTLLQKCLLKILENHGYKKILVKTFDFYVADMKLIING